MPNDPLLLDSQRDKQFYAERVAELKSEYPLLPSSAAWEVARQEILAERIYASVREAFEPHQSFLPKEVSPKELLETLDRTVCQLPCMLKHVVLSATTGTDRWPNLDLGPVIRINGFLAPTFRACSCHNFLMTPDEGVFTVDAINVLRLGLNAQRPPGPGDYRANLQTAAFNLVNFYPNPALELKCFDGRTLFRTEQNQDISIHDLVDGLRRFSTRASFELCLVMAGKGVSDQVEVEHCVSNGALISKKLETTVKTHLMQRHWELLDPARFLNLPETASRASEHWLYDYTSMYLRAKNEMSLGIIDTERRIAVAALVSSFGPSNDNNPRTLENWESIISTHIHDMRALTKVLRHSPIPFPDLVPHFGIKPEPGTQPPPFGEVSEYCLYAIERHRKWLAKFLSN